MLLYRNPPLTMHIMKTIILPYMSVFKSNLLSLLLLSLYACWLYLLQDCLRTIVAMLNDVESISCPCQDCQKERARSVPDHVSCEKKNNGWCGPERESGIPNTS